MRKITAVLFSVWALWLTTATLPAQEVYARIRGTVIDASGGGVPGAEVKAANTQTGVTSTVTSETDGTFQFLQLAVGAYQVSIAKPGFEPTLQRISSWR